MEKINKEGLEKELIDLDKRIGEKAKEIEKSEEYKLLKGKNDYLWNQSSVKNNELSRLKKEISKKYINNINNFRHRGVEYKDIKVGVKDGIKRALEIKYLNQINEDDVVIIVKKLIQNDLEEAGSKKIQEDLNNLDKEIDKSEIEIEKLKEEVETIIKERRNIYNKLHKSELNLEKIKNNNSILIENIIKENKLDKIKKEVQRGLMLEALNGKG